MDDSPTSVPNVLEEHQITTAASGSEINAGAQPELPTPSEREKVAISGAQQKLATRPRPVRVVTRQSADGQPNLDVSHSDVDGWVDRLRETFGSSSPEFAFEQLQQLIKLASSNLSPEAKEVAVNAMLATVAGVQPQNEMEGVLAVQMAATHQLAMTLLARVGRAEHIPVMETNGNMALKLLRTSREHAEALAKLRRGGNQTVRVEHVHVHSGGQAIVGSVAHSGGRGTSSKTLDQPHAPGEENADTRFLTTESVAPLWSEDPQRKAVPVTRSEGTGEVPNARRCKG